ncbi:MAG: hypothetical protein ABJG68_05035 [Crocinitomicaceae bacterium]
MAEETNNSQETPVKEGSISVKQKTTLIVSVLLVLAVIAFVVQNSNRVEIEFLFFKTRIRIVYLMLFSALGGIAGSYVFAKWRKSKKKKK